ncbi:MULTISPECIES: hypothetical protein [Micromonospora]|uniref:hypothetical protein n=1 Tax=Micromonospora TaxID=1873 RepID=UPI000A5BE778|nr:MULTISPECIES: hypothetical protein [Micromonospora]RUL94485.1 hypothetical protein EG812_01960 [Verrucosispora sp. FIM060022]
MAHPPRHGRRAVLLLALAVTGSILTAGCADPAAPGAGAQDPELVSAAQVVEAELRQSFEDTFAGLQLDHAANRLIVYRRPDPRLDARVRELAASVTVDLRDAAYSLAAMRRTVDRVVADSGYWAERGITITGAAPRADGSGVSVYTRTGDEAERTALSERYPEMPLDVQKRTIVPPTHQPPSDIVIG